MSVFAAEIISAVSEAECRRLAELATGNRVLEVGSEYGRSTIALASTATIVHAVDWHRGDPQSGFKDSLPAFLANLGAHGVRDRVIVHLGRFEDVAPVLRPQAFDLVFIDGDHSAEAIRRDLGLAIPLLRWRGVAVLHDADQVQVEAAGLAHAQQSNADVRRGHGTLLEIHLPSLAWNEEES